MKQVDIRSVDKKLAVSVDELKAGRKQPVDELQKYFSLLNK